MEAAVAEQAPTLGELGATPVEESATDTARRVWEEFSGKEAETTGKAPETAEAGDEAKPDGRPRDEHGRFVSQEPEKPVEAKPEAKPEAKVETKEAEPVKEADDVIEPPAEWTLEEQTAFRKLGSKDLQQFVLDRVSSAQEGIQAGDRFKGIEDAIAPHRDGWARRGLSDEAAIKQVLSVYEWAAREPLAYAEWFMKENGLEFADDEPKGAGEEQYVDPAMQTLEQKLAQVEEELNRTRATTEAQRMREAESVAQQLQHTITEFKDARDEKGNALHPYFGEVRPRMAALMKVDPKLDLQAAYDEACHAHPTVRAKIASAAEAAAERERQRTAREKAEAARRAGASITGETTGGSGPEPIGTDPREELRRQMQLKGML